MIKTERRPLAGVHPKGDRAYSPRFSPDKMVVLAFRVHYRDVLSKKHRVTPPLWEHEAVDFIKTIVNAPGLDVVEYDRHGTYRPDGLEPILGWDTVPTDTTKTALARAEQAGRDAVARKRWEKGLSLVGRGIECGATARAAASTFDGETVMKAMISLVNLTTECDDADERLAVRLAFEVGKAAA